MPLTCFHEKKRGFHEWWQRATFINVHWARVKRGLYLNGTGEVVNADLTEVANILQKSALRIGRRN